MTLEMQHMLDREMEDARRDNCTERGMVDSAAVPLSFCLLWHWIENLFYVCALPNRCGNTVSHVHQG